MVGVGVSLSVSMPMSLRARAQATSSPPLPLLPSMKACDKEAAQTDRHPLPSPSTRHVIDEG